MFNISFVQCFSSESGTLADRTREALKRKSRPFLTNLSLFLVSNSVFYEAEVDFMIK